MPERGKTYAALVFAACLPGCALLTPPPPGAPPEAVVAPLPPAPPDWVADPTGYGVRVGGYNRELRSQILDEALGQFVDLPDLGTQTRLALVIDHAVITAGEHRDARSRIERMLEDETMAPEVAAVLRLNHDRLGARLAWIRELARAEQRRAALASENEALESRRADTEAALQVAEEKLEALKTIERSLRRE